MCCVVLLRLIWTISDASALPWNFTFPSTMTYTFVLCKICAGNNTRILAMFEWECASSRSSISITQALVNCFSPRFTMIRLLKGEGPCAVQEPCFLLRYAARSHWTIPVTHHICELPWQGNNDNDLRWVNCHALHPVMTSRQRRRTVTLLGQG